MKSDVNLVSTGLPGLDGLLEGLRPGDNVVWEVGGIDEYLGFVRPYVAWALATGKKLVYFRFARHEALLGPQPGLDIHQLDPQEGFDSFLNRIVHVIEDAGRGAFYVFDCLTDLAADWYSDRMLGNFFMIACPFLYKLDTIAYFALLKHTHSVHATEPIEETAQVILEVYRQDERTFVQPLKVWNRHAPTMYMPHEQHGEAFHPVTSSATLSEILASAPKPWLDFTVHRPGVWMRAFLDAQEALAEARKGATAAASVSFKRLLKMALTREERFQDMAEKYFDLAALVDILKRMIGTGLIGGKSLGMLLARAILIKERPAWKKRLEAHDSFYVGSDVFYTYVVQNGCWWLRRRGADFQSQLDRAKEAKQKMLTGHFPSYIESQFREMLEYFGQSPIIVRSSSLLEDNYGNAFSGKYESVFCANQGSPDERLKAFMDAVRVVYASTMNEDALTYRRHYGLLEREEQMALLVQRVSGALYDRLYFPQVAGVGFSVNPYVWSPDIDPAAGVLRVVFGLGTRAVDRTDSDYTRVIALSAPERQAGVHFDEVHQYVQRRADVLDLRANQLLSRDVKEAAARLPEDVLKRLASIDENMLERARLAGTGDVFPWALTFEGLLKETDFVRDMQEIVQVLHRAYEHPVDIEFTLNFLEDGQYRINLLQCRPFQARIKAEGSRVRFPSGLPRESVLIGSRGPIIGQSAAAVVDLIVYVVPSVYGKLPIPQRYSVARAIGRLTHRYGEQGPKTIMLIGPGRWGTSMPSLGIPVSFSEIDNVSVLCELALMHEGLVPDVSLGTHFFNDLVEMDMLYMAVFPEREGHVLNENLLRARCKPLSAMLPDAGAAGNAVWLIDSADFPPGQAMYLTVDSMAQRALCYIDERREG